MDSVPTTRFQESTISTNIQRSNVLNNPQDVILSPSYTIQKLLYFISSLDIWLFNSQLGILLASFEAQGLEVYLFGNDILHCVSHLVPCPRFKRQISFIQSHIAER
jgi:hypothetical protein